MVFTADLQRMLEMGDEVGGHGLARQAQVGHEVQAHHAPALGQQALFVTLLVSAPLLLVALAVGLLVSIVQAATQINEMTLSFIPKLIALFATLVVAGPWILSLLVELIRASLTAIPGAIG